MITSARSRKVRALRRLRLAEHRDALGFVLVEGPHALASILEAGALVDEVAVTPRGDRAHRALLARAEAAGARAIRVSDEAMGGLAGTSSPPGLLASVRRPEFPTDAGSAANIALYLEAIADPASLGAILQAAVATGVGRVLLGPGTVDPWNVKVIRSSVAAGWWIPIERAEPETVFAATRADGRVIVAVDPDGPESGLPDGRILLVWGDPGTSLTEVIRCSPPRTPFPLGPSVAIATLLAGRSA